MDRDRPLWRLRTLAPAVAALAIVAALAPARPAFADKIRNDQWYLAALRVPEAHVQSRGEGVVVAVVDTGVQADHPDLAGSVLPGTDTVPGGTGDGRADADGHGTATASLIVGHGHGSAGGDGVLGIAPQARLLPIRTTVSRQSTNDATALGINWAVEHGANIICVPNGGGFNLALIEAVTRALKREVLIVAAAGNRPHATGVDSPASYPGVVAAAATGRDGNYHAVSVTGPEIVLAAPGANIVSANEKGGYRDGTGTSDAAAIIAGAAALVRAKYPHLTAKQVVDRLTATATDRGPPGRDEQYGFGVLNLVEALTADLPEPSSGGPPAPGTDPSLTAAAPNEPPGGGRGPLILLAVGVPAALVVVAALALAQRRRREAG